MTKAANKAKTISASTAVALAAANQAPVVNTNVETISAASAPAEVTTVVAATAQAAPDTKAAKARAVFAKAYPDGKTTTMQRKDIIGAMIAEAGLTKAGAATYLQNMKNKAGITVHRTAVTA